MNCIMDASGMLALLRDEPGAAVVAAVLADPNNECYAHALNLCEVFYDIHRERGEIDAQTALTTLASLGIVPREDLDAAFWQEAGRLKSVYRRISLADCCAAVLAQRLGGELVTADRHELQPLESDGVIPIRFIR